MFQASSSYSYLPDDDDTSVDEESLTSLGVTSIDIGDDFEDEEAQRRLLNKPYTATQKRPYTLQLRRAVLTTGMCVFGIVVASIVFSRIEAITQTLESMMGSRS